MALYRTTFPVAASADRVWEVISDFAGWSGWNPSVPSIKGELRTGSTCKVKLVMHGRPSVNVKVTLTDVDPGRRFAWHGNIAHDRFFAGDRSLEIEPQPDGTVLVTHTEEVTGAFFPVFKTLMGAATIQAHHDELNAGLKQRAEL
ncbi:SRPBCC domain-containing protein [Nocardioides humilatus]|uniref:SRPBCC domain-containing protein n=1 Tax=Nocardioides humilatus TaxID=2607660 RepID=A0A5B1L6V5_9ACTN|nr:SRPBCC domain-containing protein [Nocardioides humilatus]KAA1416441.1 SRPBCC domain-containing protein [Nocardioides humilatus]